MKLKYFLTIILWVLTLSCFSQTDTTDNNQSDTTYRTIRKTFEIELIPNIGVALIRNTLAPNVYLSLKMNVNNKYQLGLNASSYYLFERDTARNFKMYGNLFAGIEFLKPRELIVNGNNERKEESADWWGIGISYLIENNGDYFNDPTFKVYFINEIEHITILPELIFTDNFNTLFPGVTIIFHF